MKLAVMRQIPHTNPLSQKSVTPGELRELGKLLKVVRDQAGVAADRAARLLHRRRLARRPRRARQRALYLQRIAPWADHSLIAAIYTEAAHLTRLTGIEHEVDHIVPLLGARVSGLHVEHNLRIIPKAHNRAKGNRFDV